MTDIFDDLIAAMHAAGVIPKNPADIVLDGRLHRFPVERDKPGKKTGWVCGHSDGVSNAVFGDWRTSEEGIKWVAQMERGDNTQTVKIDPHAKEKRDVARADEQKQASETARQLWERSPSADPGHGYLQKKNIPPFGLKQDGDALIVPFRDIETGEISTIQTINPDGRKGYHKGATKQGAAYTVGAGLQGSILLCEGVATAHTLHEMSGLMVIAAGDCGNMKSLAKSISTKYKGRKIIVAADNDHTKEKNAGIEAAKEAVKIGGLAGYMLPFFGAEEQGSDYNDYFQLHGEDEAAGELKKQIDNLLYRFSKLACVIDPNDPAGVYIPKMGGLFSRGELNQIFAAPGAGKSFFAQRVLSDIAHGGEVLGGFFHQEKPIRSLLLAGESPRSLYVQRARLMNWQASPNFQLIDVVEKSLDVDIATEQGRGIIRELLDEIKPELLCLDSFSSFFTCDESDSQSMKEILMFLRSEAQSRSVAVLLIHHGRKRKLSEQNLPMSQDESSGSGVLGRWCAQTISVQKQTDEVNGEKLYVVSSQKCRDGESFKPFSFSIERGSMPVKLDVEVERKSKRFALWEAITKTFAIGIWFGRVDVEEKISLNIGKPYISECLGFWVDTEKLRKRGSGRKIEYSIGGNLFEIS